MLALSSVSDVRVDSRNSLGVLSLPLSLSVPLYLSLLLALFLSVSLSRSLAPSLSLSVSCFLTFLSQSLTLSFFVFSLSLSPCLFSLSLSLSFLSFFSFLSFLYFFVSFLLSLSLSLSLPLARSLACSLSLSLACSLCLSLALFLTLSLSLYLSLLLCLSLRLFFFLSFFPLLFLSVFLAFFSPSFSLIISLSLSPTLSLCLSLSLSFSLSACLSVCLSVCLSLNLSSTRSLSVSLFVSLSPSSSSSSSSSLMLGLQKRRKISTSRFVTWPCRTPSRCRGEGLHASLGAWGRDVGLPHVSHKSYGPNRVWIIFSSTAAFPRLPGKRARSIFHESIWLHAISGISQHCHLQQRRLKVVPLVLDSCAEADEAGESELGVAWALNDNTGSLRAWCGFPLASAALPPWCWRWPLWSCACAAERACILGWSADVCCRTPKSNHDLSLKFGGSR